METEPIEILLVEDSEADVKLALHALRAEQLTARIHVARDGEEALEVLVKCASNAIKEHEPVPKLILLDLKLPKVDGLELLQRIKESPATRMIPVVILTSSSDEEDMCKCYLHGANSYIQKPLDYDSFRKIVKDLCAYWLVLNQMPTSVVPPSSRVIEWRGPASQTQPKNEEPIRQSSK